MVIFSKKNNNNEAIFVQTRPKNDERLNFKNRIFKDPFIYHHKQLYFHLIVSLVCKDVIEYANVPH